MKHILKQVNNINHKPVSELFDEAVDSNQANLSPFLVIIFICFLFSIGFVIFDSCLFDNSKLLELDGKININNASAASIMRLPGIGISKAESIILYRQNCGRQKAFKTSQDLIQIHGIGVKTADGVKPYIKFE